MSPGAGIRTRLGPHGTRVAAVAALVLAALSVLWIVTSAERGTYEVRAVFDDVRGLIPGGEVRAGAIPVGRVESVELNADDEPEVTMRVSDDFRLHEGAIADIRLGSNVGVVNRTVELSQGDVDAPELADGTVLRGRHTDQPVNFDTAVETLDPPTRANIRRFLAGLDATLAGRGRDIDRTLERSGAATVETANLLAQVASDGEALRTLVRQGERVTSALAQSPDDLGAAIEQTALLLDTTAGRQAELAESVELLGPALARGRQALDALADASPRLRELVRGLDPVVDELGPFARVVPEAGAAAGPFLTETRRLVEVGPRELRRFRPIIAAADRVSVPLDRLVRRALPLAQELRVYTPEIIGFFQNFGAAAGSYDANGHALNLAVGNAQSLPDSTASSRIGPADCTPGLLELPYIRLPGTNECLPWEDFESSYIFPEDG